MSIYLIGIPALVLLAVCMAFTWRVAKKKGIWTAVVFALVVWLVPFVQLHADDVTKICVGLFGYDPGFQFFLWGRSAIFAVQLASGLCLARLWLRKEPNQPAQTMPLKRHG